MSPFLRQGRGVRGFSSIRTLEPDVVAWARETQTAYKGPKRWLSRAYISNPKHATSNPSCMMNVQAKTWN